jgi:hypothetical protein
MKQLLNDVLEFFSFLLLMMVLGVGSIVYSVFVLLYWIFAKVTGQEHLIK